MIKIQHLILFLFLGPVFYIGCREKPQAWAELPELVRFETLLMQLDTQNLETDFLELEARFPAFVPLFFSEVLPISGYEEKNDTFFQHLKGFITDRGVREIYELVRDQYGDFDPYLNPIAAGLEKAKIWFPDSRNPRIYTFISEFSYQQFLFEDTDGEGLAIGLDLFLQDVFDYSVMQSGTNAFSQYLTRTYDKTHLSRKVLDAWIGDKMGLVRGDRLIDHMIYNGTRLYLLDEILNLPDSVLLEQPGEKVDWLKNNEEPMWSFYFQNDWFYTTDQYVIKRLVEPAPNSMALKMPTAAPGQTGNYLGWKIVKSYMKRFPETGVETLLNTNAQQILEASRFKPGESRR
jgi:hypothetical protein